MKSPFGWFKREVHNMWSINRWPLIGIAITFVLGILAGYTLSLDAKLILIESVGVKFEGILTAATSTVGLSLHIFENNMLVALLSFGLGFTFFLPVLVIFSNGLIVGVFLHLLQRADAVNPGTLIGGVASLIPHGIFELPALFLAGAFSMVIVQKIVMPHSVVSNLSRRTLAWQNTLRFVGWVTTLLLVAALMEAFVSGALSKQLQTWVATDRTDTRLLVNLDSRFLLQNNCVPSPALEASEESLSGSTLTNIAKVVFNDDLYSRFQYRSSLPQWSEFYLCNDNVFITIETWHKTQWSIAEAATLTSKMYDILGFQYQYNNNMDGVDLRVKQQEDPFAVYIREIDGKTTVITVSDPDMPINDLLPVPGLNTLDQSE